MKVTKMNSTVLADIIIKQQMNFMDYLHENYNVARLVAGLKCPPNRLDKIIEVVCGVRIFLN